MKTSVVVPIYNAEKYIRRCIESIIHQTYENWELILVDDGSTDGSGAICKEYADKDSRIVLLQQENFGQVVARKNGLAKASGEFTALVDADDWVDEDYIEQLLELQSNVDVDYISSDLIYEYEDYCMRPDGLMVEGVYEEAVIVKNVLPKFLYDLDADKVFMRHTLPGTLVKTNLLRQGMDKVNPKIRFDEDGLTVLNVLLLIKKMYITHYKGYHYRQNQTSITHASDLRLIDNIKLLKNEYKELLKNYMVKSSFEKQFGRFVQLVSTRCVANELGYTYCMDFCVPHNMLKSRSRVIVYGAGARGIDFVKKVKQQEQLQIVAWVDKEYKFKPKRYGITDPDKVWNMEFDYILIAIENIAIQRTVEKYLLDHGVPFGKIWPLETKWRFKI